MRRCIKVLVWLGLSIWLFIFSQNSFAEEKKTVIADFEDISDWECGQPDQPFPEWANFTLSTEQVHNGKYSGKLSWDRSDTESDGVSLYYKKKLPEKATEIGCWVHGGFPAMFIIYLVDNKGHQFQYSLRILWTGWKFIKWNMEEDMDPWTANPEIESPLFFSHIGIGLGSMDVAESGRKGTIYFDDLTAIESEKKPIPETFYEKPSTLPLISNPPRGGLWFQIQEPYNLGKGDIDKDKETLDVFKSNGLLDCLALTSYVTLRPSFRPAVKEGFDGFMEGYFGDKPEAPDSYFRKLCRTLEGRGIYFVLVGGNYWFYCTTNPESEYNNYVKRLGKIASVEAPNHFLGFGVTEYRHQKFNGGLSLADRKKRANLTIRQIQDVLKSQELDPRQAHITGIIDKTQAGYAYEAGFYVNYFEPLFDRFNQTFEIIRFRGAARSFGDGQIWGGIIAPWVGDWVTGEEAYHHPECSWIGFSDEEIYKSFIREYYIGSQFMGIDHWFLKEDGTLTFAAEVSKRFFNYIKDHPRVGVDYTKTAIVQSYLDNSNIYGPSQSKGRHYHEWMAPYIGDPDRDWIFLNLWFPHICHDENMSFCPRYWTGTPYGPIDIIYDRVPDLERALSNYEKVFLMGYQDITDEMYKGLANYVSKGGILFVEAPHLTNLKPSSQKELFGCEVKPTLISVVGKIAFINHSIFDYPKGEDYPKNAVESQGSKIYKLEIKDGEVIAKDGWGNPILVGKRHGKGYVLLLANYLYNLKNYGYSTAYPTLNSFTYTVLDKIANYPSLSLDILPKNDYIEFFARKNKEEVQIFLMNHGTEEWKGEVIVDKKVFGVGEKVKVSEVAEGGYKDIDSERVTSSEESLKIKIFLEGNGEREAKFRLIKVGH